MPNNKTITTQQHNNNNNSTLNTQQQQQQLTTTNQKKNNATNTRCITTLQVYISCFFCCYHTPRKVFVRSGNISTILHLLTLYLPTRLPRTQCPVVLHHSQLRVQATIVWVYTRLTKQETEVHLRSPTLMVVVPLIRGGN